MIKWSWQLQDPGGGVAQELRVGGLLETRTGLERGLRPDFPSAHPGFLSVFGYNKPFSTSFSMRWSLGSQRTGTFRIYQPGSGPVVELQTSLRWGLKLAFSKRRELQLHWLEDDLEETCTSMAQHESDRATLIPPGPQARKPDTSLVLDGSTPTPAGSGQGTFLLLIRTSKEWWGGLGFSCGTKSQKTAVPLKNLPDEERNPRAHPRHTRTRSVYTGTAAVHRGKDFLKDFLKLSTSVSEIMHLVCQRTKPSFPKKHFEDFFTYK